VVKGLLFQAGTFLMDTLLLKNKGWGLRPVIITQYVLTVFNPEGLQKKGPRGNNLLKSLFVNGELPRTYQMANM